MSGIDLVCRFSWMGARATGWVQHGRDVEIAGKFGEIIHV